MQYHPHDYQTYATNFILEHPVAAVLLEMGLGKSVCTLTAIYELMLNRFEVESVLVIAPLRVARDTWPAEIEKWDHLKGLTYSVVIGTEAERIAVLNRPAHIYFINRENVDWLISKSGIPFDFDMVVLIQILLSQTIQESAESKTKDKKDGGTYWYTIQQRTYGSVGRISNHGYGSKTRSVHNELPKYVLCAG